MANITRILIEEHLQQTAEKDPFITLLIITREDRQTQQETIVVIQEIQITIPEDHPTLQETTVATQKTPLKTLDDHLTLQETTVATQKTLLKILDDHQQIQIPKKIIRLEDLVLLPTRNHTTQQEEATLLIQTILKGPILHLLGVQVLL